MNAYVKRVFKKSKQEILGLSLLCMYQMCRVSVYKYLLSTNSPVLHSVRLKQAAQFVGKGQIFLSGVIVGVWPSPRFTSSAAYFEARSPGSRLSIGKGTILNNGAVIIADKGNVMIGANCLIGSGFYVSDSDFHGLELEKRRMNDYVCKDVCIGDNVFIGNDVKILKGVVVGEGAVIGTGSIVVASVPANSVYAGVPAKLIKML